MGCLVVADTPKEDAKTALAALRSAGIRKTVMLTGDRRQTALAMAKRLGVDEVKAELLPQDKVEAFESLMGQGKVLFVGDGINDAPVLARADVGIAMGALGSDAAIEASDIVIMTDQLERIADAVSISRRTLSISRQNIVFALAVKGLVLALSALGMSNMWIAIFSDVGVAVLCILNSMRTLRS
jgi:Cd2+/Zn2+-exporting ATPase